MKIIAEKPTTSLKEGVLELETWEITLTTTTGTLRIFERGDGKLAVIGDVAISPMGRDELTLDVL